MPNFQAGPPMRPGEVAALNGRLGEMTNWWWYHLFLATPPPATSPYTPILCLLSETKTRRGLGWPHCNYKQAIMVAVEGTTLPAFFFFKTGQVEYAQ